MSYGAHKRLEVYLWAIWYVSKQTADEMPDVFQAGKVLLTTVLAAGLAVTVSTESIGVSAGLDGLRLMDEMMVTLLHCTECYHCCKFANVNMI